MEPKDYLTLGLSLFALVVSVIAAMRTWSSSVATFRNSSRNNYMTALFDLNRQVMTNPQLWAVYQPEVKLSSQDELEAVRRHAFIWYHLNVFEVVHSDYSTHRLTRKLDRADTLCWKSWDNFISSVLEGSKEARGIVESDKSMRFLNEEFVKYLRSKLPAAPAAGYTVESFKSEAGARSDRINS